MDREIQKLLNIYDGSIAENERKSGKVEADDMINVYKYVVNQQLNKTGRIEDSGLLMESIYTALKVGVVIGYKSHEFDMKSKGRKAGLDKKREEQKDGENMTLK